MAHTLHKILKHPWKLQIKYISSTSNQPIPTQSQVVICGSGVVGNSVAFHLTKQGWTDVLVIEQNVVGSGTSSYGSGVLGLFRSSSERWVVTQSLQLIEELQKQGFDLGLNNCGSINLAQTRDRAVALKRRLANMKPSGMQCEWLNQVRIRDRFPFLYASDLEGAVFVPEDSVADIETVCSTLAQLAKKQGAQYIEKCEVLGIDSVVSENASIPRVSAVHTSRGTISCEYFVNAAGMWARQLGMGSNPPVSVPAFPADHFFLHTLPMEEASKNLPIVRDYDSHSFCLVRNKEFIIGGFEPTAKPAFEKGVPSDWKEQLVSDEKHFEFIKKSMEKRIPILQNASYSSLLNAPDNFTPDGKWILGETPEIDNYFVAVGMNGNSLQGGIGSGLAVAHWIIHGAPPPGMTLFDVRRFSDLYNNRRFLMERIKEIVGKHYDIEYPGQTEFKYARKLRCSPLYSELEDQGAVFGERMLFERPLYFDANHEHGQPPSQLPQGSFGKPQYLDNVKTEYYACKDGVGVIDLSSFTKLEIKAVGIDKEMQFDAEESRSAGNHVVEYLQKLCSNDVELPVGGVVHTGMHNEEGGYENDCILVRTTADSYFMLAPTNQQTRVMDWMRRQIGQDSCVSVTDITSMYSVLVVAGPKSKDVMSHLCNTDLSFHAHVAKYINVAYASGILTLSYTHMGEPGYTMVIPSEYTLNIYETLKKVGHDYGLRNVGMNALRKLRVEKFIPFWGEELNSTVNPYEVGREDRVKLNKPYFIGRLALEQFNRVGVKRRLVYFTLEKYDAETSIWPSRNEPIYRNDKPVGTVTSSAFTLGKMVCLGWVSDADGKYITKDYIMGNATFEIDLSGTKVKAKPSLQPPSVTLAKTDGQVSYRPRRRGILA